MYCNHEMAQTPQHPALKIALLCRFFFVKAPLVRFFRYADFKFHAMPIFVVTPDSYLISNNQFGESRPILLN